MRLGEGGGVELSPFGDRTRVFLRSLTLCILT